MASVAAERFLFGLCALVMVAALLLGGGTRSGFLSDALLQLVAIPLLIAALWGLSDLAPDKRPWGAMAFCFAIVLVPLLQLVPLPPAIWTAFPNREPVVEVFMLLGREIPWRPLSVSPHATWLSALSLLVPLAIFLGVLLLADRQRRALSLIVIGVGLASVFIGLAQVAAGPNSWLRFFAFTNVTEAVGFFANRNHFAALLYSGMLLAAAWAVDASLSGDQRTQRGRLSTATLVPLIASFTVLVMFVAAQAMARSRGGLGLTIFALLGAYAIALADKRATSGFTPAKLLAGATALAIIFASQFALYRIMERFAADPLQDARVPFARTTIEAAQAYMPFGSGMGTFVPVYAMFEKPQDVLANTYANRAHNDILELWLETGVVGLALMAVFAIWFGLRCWRIWGRRSFGARTIDQSLARAATLIIALLIAHSVVDYPLRTGAMAAIFALACAFLIKSPQASESAEWAEPQSSRESLQSELSGHGAFAEPATRAQWSAPAPRPGTPPYAPVRETQTKGARWGENIEWPEEWRQDRKRRDPSGDDEN